MVTICVVKNKLETVAIANALQLGDRTTSHHSLLAVFGQFGTAHAYYKNCCLPSSNQNSDTAIRFRFSDTNMLKESDNLATRRRFYAVRDLDL